MTQVSNLAANKRHLSRDAKSVLADLPIIKVWETAAITIRIAYRNATPEEQEDIAARTVKEIMNYVKS
jgi:hypothetical protein